MGTRVMIASASAITCHVGEGPIWDPRVDRLHYVDITGRALLTLDPVTGFVTHRPMPEMIGFVALTPDPRIVIGGLHGGLRTIDLETGRSQLLCPVELARPGIRINDGTVAPDGAIIFGTMEIAAEKQPVGTFFRWYRGVLTQLGGTMKVTNGPAFAPDGETVLTADTTERKILRHRYVGGAFVDTSVFAVFPLDAGLPDGLAFDVEGHVWVAHYGGGRVTRFRPDGSVAQVLELPATQITKACFGGADLKVLYVTSAARGLSLAVQPEAGHLFSVPVNVAGLRPALAMV
jgi:sugar lactone lactonase YvrE